MIIKIKSVDSFEQHYEKEFKITDIVNLLTQKEYHYNDEYGKCKVINKSNSIEIFRHGEINSKQVFKLGEMTSFTYITKEFKSKYKIFTKKIHRSDRKIILDYDIIDGTEIINSINLEISYKMMLN